MPPRTEKGRAIARTNLRPAPPAPKGHDRSLKHGAHSASLIQPIREELFRDLVARFPGEDPDLLLNQARRLAQARVIDAFTDRQGNEIATPRKLGSLLRAMEYQDKVAGAYDRGLVLLERRQAERDLAAKAGSALSLEDVVAELTAADDSDHVDDAPAEQQPSTGDAA